MFIRDSARFCPDSPNFFLSADWWTAGGVLRVAVASILANIRCVQHRLRGTLYTVNNTAREAKRRPELMLSPPLLINA